MIPRVPARRSSIVAAVRSKATRRVEVGCGGVWRRSTKGERSWLMESTRDEMKRRTSSGAGVGMDVHWHDCLASRRHTSVVCPACR